GELMGFGLHELLERGRDFIVVEGTIATLRMETELLQFEVRAPAPYMDFLIAHENRMWGCRYGEDRDGGFVNEIYACALGDFSSWYRYEGIVSDSYALSLGEPGPFTGAAVVGGYPVFFKENSIHKVYGSTPSTFSLQSIPCVGIAPGSEKSPALLQNGLIYQGRDGFYLYDGSLPVRISGDLGQKVYRNAVSGTQGHLYYAACEAEDGSHPVLCYDSLRKLWHRESALRPKEFLESDGILYYRTDSPGLFALGGKVGAPAESLVYWEAVSGIFREEAMEKGVLVGLRLRLALEPGSALDLYGEFDSSGVWEPLGSLGGRRLSLQEIPFRIRPCDHFRLKLRGRGDGRIHSLILITEE
ncbi:MAG: hypothetical protein IKM59_07495, partial [Oscillospiraceae bacterium]|nr:hypothetical protein [Oscillospiraceae bacterium]